MKLFKTTITVVSEYNPDVQADMELSDLVRDSESGESYCLGSAVEEINCEDLDGDGVKDFFNCLGEDK